MNRDNPISLSDPDGDCSDCGKGEEGDEVKSKKDGRDYINHKGQWKVLTTIKGKSTRMGLPDPKDKLYTTFQGSMYFQRGKFVWEMYSQSPSTGSSYYVYDKEDDEWDLFQTDDNYWETYWNTLIGVHEFIGYTTVSFADLPLTGSAAGGYMLARTGGKSTLTKLLAKKSAEAAAKGEKAIVLGEGMYRVKSAARSVSAKWYQAWSKNFPSGGRLMTEAELKAALARNARWLNSKISQGYKIYDIGSKGTNIVSPFYKLERSIIQKTGYPTTPLLGF